MRLGPLTPAALDCPMLVLAVQHGGDSTIRMYVLYHFGFFLTSFFDEHDDHHPSSILYHYSHYIKRDIVIILHFLGQSGIKKTSRWAQ